MNKKDGFSIIELITVVFIIALMALAAFAVFKGFRERTSVKVAARDVTNIMRLARQKAVTDRIKHRVAVDTSETDGEDSTRDEVWLERYESGTATWVEVTEPRVHRIMDKEADITDVTNNTGTVYIQFFPKSTADAYSVHITNRPAVPPANDEATRRKYYTVTTIAQTARVKIYNYGRNSPFPATDL